MESVILVRHGQSTANIQKIISHDLDVYPLTEKGKDQVRRISSQLVGSRISGVISSPVLRARQTSEIIAETLSCSYSVDDRIRESGIGKYNNFRMALLPPEEAHEKLGMESWESHTERFLSIIGSAKGRYILVSHAYPIRAIISYYLGLGEHESPGIEVRNASVSVINIEEEKVLSIGSLAISKRLKEFLES